jgi:hypothetical protein
MLQVGAVAIQLGRDGQIHQPVSGQRLCKHVPAATDTNAAIE